MKLVIAEEIPFTIVWKVLVVVDRVLVLIIDEVAEIPFVELVKKKNELDYINSPFFIEKQLRESLNYYRSGEKLLVFTENNRPKQTTAANQESL